MTAEPNVPATPPAPSDFVRDIVQFVALRDFVGKPVPLLAREVLREVPSQVLTYFTQKGIVPNAPAALPQQGPIPPQHA